MRFLLTFLGTVVYMASLAQYSFQAYTPANGLVDARVHAIFQDKKGVLYFLTRDGFSSFDGQRFTNFTELNDLPISVTNNMVQLKDGSLALSTLNGIYCLKGNEWYKDTVTFKAVVEPGDWMSLPNEQWLLPAYSGLFIFNGRQLRQLDIQTLDSTQTPFNVDKTVAAGHFMAALMDKKLKLYNYQTEQVTDVLANTAVLDLVQYNGIIYIKTEKGWLQLNPLAWNKGKLVAETLSFQHRIPTGFPFSNFYMDPQQNIWLIGVSNSLCYIPAGSGSPVFYTTLTGLPTNINQVITDAEGNVWMLAYGKAVYKLVQGRAAPFILEKKSKTLSLYGSPEGVVLSKNDSLVTYTPKGKQTHKMSRPAGCLQVFYWNNDWWYLLSEGALVSAAGRRVVLHRVVEGTYSIAIKPSFDQLGRLLISGNYCNIIDKNYQQWSIKLPYFTDRVIADAANDYWCFSRGGHIVQYRLQGDSLATINTQAGLRYSPREALHWGGDTFCIGTRIAGLLLLKVEKTGYRYLSLLGRSRGLSNNFVAQLLRTGPHNLLAATVTGLDMFHFNPSDTVVEQLYGRINIFDGVNGLATLNDSTILALNADQMVYQINMRQASSTGYAPQVFFNQIRVNGQQIDTTKLVSFAYNQNNLRFVVSAPSFIDEKNIRFLFQLTGSALKTTQQGLSADFEIANLPPGDYQLTVTVNFPGYQYMAQSAHYRFTIRKPFWKTMGFILASAVLLLLAGYLLFRSVLRRRLLQQRIQLEKEKAVAGERSRIATDMHDELGAGISTIKYLSQSAPFIAPEVQKENNLKIAAQADELVDKMNDIIWAMNESNDTLDNLIYYCKAWVVVYCDMHHLPIKVQVPESIPSITVRGDMRQHVFLCIKEAVHNAVKHAGATALELTFKLEAGKLNMVVSDNGKGFDRQKIKLGNGLHNMQKRIEQLKGVLEIDSTNGTSLHFSVPL